MNSKQKSDTTSNTTKQTDTAKGTQSTATQPQEIIDREASQGFRGSEVDSTPNENYTVAGVTSGAPTPETDVESAKQVRQETGLGLSALEAAAREKQQERGK